MIPKGYDRTFYIYGKKLPYNQISYTRISPKNGSGSVNLLNTNNWFFNCGCCTLYFDKSGPQPNLQMNFFGGWVGYIGGVAKVPSVSTNS